MTDTSERDELAEKFANWTCAESTDSDDKYFAQIAFQAGWSTRDAEVERLKAKIYGLIEAAEKADQ